MSWTPTETALFQALGRKPAAWPFGFSREIEWNLQEHGDNHPRGVRAMVHGEIVTLYRNSTWHRGQDIARCHLADFGGDVDALADAAYALAVESAKSPFVRAA